MLIERRAVEPILPPRLFSNQGFVLAVGAGAVVAVAMFGTVNYLPTYLQMVHGVAPLPVLGLATIGLLLIPSRRLADQREPLGTDGLGSRQSTGAR